MADNPQNTSDNTQGTSENLKEDGCANEIIKDSTPNSDSVGVSSATKDGIESSYMIPQREILLPDEIETVWEKSQVCIIYLYDSSVFFRYRAQYPL